MDAFVLGAVPPYSYLLCGKLVAMLVTSDTVRLSFQKKYEASCSLINHKVHDGNLALVTTTSALGRSSIYNRLRWKDELLYESVGYTKGWGEFHFANGVYGEITKFVQENCEPTAKRQRWGTGYRNRREVIKKCLPEIGLSGDWLYHGVAREVFVVPLASNSREFLRGECPIPKWYCRSEASVFDYFRERWLLPRADRDDRFRSWSPAQWISLARRRKNLFSKMNSHPSCWPNSLLATQKGLFNKSKLVKGLGLIPVCLRITAS